MPTNDDNRRDWPHSDEGGGLFQIRPQLAGATMPVGTQATDLPAQFTAPTGTRVRRVNVNFSEQAYETLEELAARSGKSMSDVLREAIALKAWFDRERAAGNRILVERPGGQLREVISVST